MKDIKTFYKKIITSRSTKEIWKIVHPILNHSKKTMKADTSELNKYFGKTTTLLVTLTAMMNSKIGSSFF